jgi:hypothetical protein
MVEGDTLNWEQYIAPLTLFYNTQVHRATKHSPFYLTYLHPPRLPYFDMDLSPKYASKWVEDARTRMLKLNKLVRANIMDEQKKSAPLKENASANRVLRAGDPCMVHYHRGTKGTIGTNIKFETTWDDGYEVIKRIGRYTYLVRQGKKKPKTIHIDRLKYDSSERAIEKNSENHEFEVGGKCDEKLPLKNRQFKNVRNNHKFEFGGKCDQKMTLKNRQLRNVRNGEKFNDLNWTLEIEESGDADGATQPGFADRAHRGNYQQPINQEARANYPQAARQRQPEPELIQHIDDDEFYDAAEDNISDEEEDEGNRRQPAAVPATPPMRPHRGRALPEGAYRDKRSYKKK